MPTDDEIFAQQRQMAVTRMLRPRAFSHTTYVDGAYGSFDPGEEGGGEPAPAWVPENAKIHIDFLGGTPQGRAWVDGTGEVNVDTLLGADANTENSYSGALYDPDYLNTHGYVPLSAEGSWNIAFIGSLRTFVLDAATIRFQIKQIGAGETGSSAVFLAASDGNDAIEFSGQSDVSRKIEAYSWGGDFIISQTDIINQSDGAINMIAFTITGSRGDMAANGGTAITGVLDETDRPPGNPLVAGGFASGYHGSTSIGNALQSITIYDPLPSTAGLSELSEP